MAGPGDPRRTVPHRRRSRGDLRSAEWRAQETLPEPAQEIREERKHASTATLQHATPAPLVLEGEVLRLPADADALRVAEWRPASRGNQRIGPQARGAAVGAASPSARRTKPLRGGKDRGIDHEPSTSVKCPLDSEFTPHLYRRAVPCYSRAWLRLAAVSARFLTSRPSGTLPKAPPCPSIQSTLKQKLCPSRLRPPRLHPQGRRGLR